MVITTNTCSFSEYKIYPGRGIKFVTRDCKVHFFINRKVNELFKRKTKAVKLTWTQAWRRYFQKSKAEQAVKKRVKRKEKVEKAIEGLTLETIQKMRLAEEKNKVKASSKDIKERQRKLQDDKKKANKAKAAGDQQKKVAQKAPVPKNVKAPKKQA
jgi:large subunit ribosomal protein L24e